VTAPTAMPRADFRLDAYLADECARVDAALAALLPSLTSSVAEGLRAPVAYALQTPGKRLRPILCVAAHRAAGGRAGDALYRLACAVEIVHTYSLVHDDLPSMDDDDLRRGRPTVHRVYGVARATLAGAALIPAAVRVLDAAAAEMGLDEAVHAALAGELCRAGGACGMVGGQVDDLAAEARPVDGAALENIHRRKTAALLCAALRLGGIAAAADDRLLAAYTRYGEELGLAFQIQDDVLDVTGTDAALGKTAGRDRSLNKATYPALYGLPRAREMARERVARAVEALRGAGVASPPLEALAGYVVERER
jgi:geranylgeranyl diphosphate synthase, type II